MFKLHKFNKSKQELLLETLNNTYKLFDIPINSKYIYNSKENLHYYNCLSKDCIIPMYCIEKSNRLLDINNWQITIDYTEGIENEIVYSYKALYEDFDDSIIEQNDGNFFNGLPTIPGHVCRRENRGCRPAPGLPGV